MICGKPKNNWNNDYDLKVLAKNIIRDHKQDTLRSWTGYLYVWIQFVTLDGARKNVLLFEGNLCNILHHHQPFTFDDSDYKFYSVAYLTAVSNPSDPQKVGPPGAHLGPSGNELGCRWSHFSRILGGLENPRDYIKVNVLYLEHIISLCTWRKMHRELEAVGIHNPIVSISSASIGSFACQWSVTNFEKAGAGLLRSIGITLKGSTVKS